MGRISYLEYSNRDMKYAHGMFELGFYDPCGRHCQQSVEKRMKHYIELKGTPEDLYFLGTHNLRRLYEKVCLIADVKINQIFKSQLSDLTDYYFDTNYPKDFNIELAEEDARVAIDSAATINDWIDSLL